LHSATRTSTDRWAKASNAPVVSISVDPATGGYWMVGSTRGVRVPRELSTAPRATALNAPFGQSSRRTPERVLALRRSGGVFPFGASTLRGGHKRHLARRRSGSLDTSASRILAVARSQVGQTDPYLYGPVGSGWCAYFISWVWEHAGIPIPPVAMAYEVALGHSPTAARCSTDGHSSIATQFCSSRPDQPSRGPTVASVPEHRAREHRRRGVPGNQ